jgi:hypothetical protein
VLHRDPLSPHRPLSPSHLPVTNNHRKHQLKTQSTGWTIRMQRISTSPPLLATRSLPVLLLRPSSFPCTGKWPDSLEYTAPSSTTSTRAGVENDYTVRDEIELVPTDALRPWSPYHARICFQTTCGIDLRIENVANGAVLPTRYVVCQGLNEKLC